MMFHATIPLWRGGEYQYDTGTAFLPTLTAYVPEGDNRRDSVLILPGGAYRFVSPSEGELVAMKFLEQGYNAFVLTYTTRTSTHQPPVGKQALRDAARAMVMIRENADAWHVHSDHVAVVGFSAGGHLAACLSVFWDNGALADIPGASIHTPRPDAAVLCYPVITAREEACHKLSFANLLGEQASRSQREAMSPELWVRPHTCPTFLWHTLADETVPAENTLLYASALRKAGIPFELHVFPTEPHGSSTSDNTWVNYRHDYLASPLFAQPRLLATPRLMAQGKTAGDEEVVHYLSRLFPFAPKPGQSADRRHNAAWVRLCTEWLAMVFRRGI